MKRIYCDQGQASASITINGITYTTDSPPIEVDTDSIIYSWRSEYPYNIQNPTRTFVGRSVVLGRGSTIKPFEDGVGWLRPYVQLLLDNGQILERKYSENPRVINYTAYDTDYANDTAYYYDLLQGFIVKDANQVLMYSQVNGIPDYKINCDGCEEGECKGEISKHPGYICMDCEQMKGRINNMSRKIDNVTKG